MSSSPIPVLSAVLFCKKARETASMMTLYTTALQSGGEVHRSKALYKLLSVFE